MLVLFERSEQRGLAFKNKTSLTKKIEIMKTYTFTDILTNETFEITCEPFEVHNIENTNKELGKWCEGRILVRIEN